MQCSSLTLHVGNGSLCFNSVVMATGYPEYELVAGGSEIAVTASNVGEYVEAVVDATLGSGVNSQLQAFRYTFETSPTFWLSNREGKYSAQLSGKDQKLRV